MVEEFKRKYGEFVWIYQLGKLMKSLVQGIGCKANSEPRVYTPFSDYVLKFCLNCFSFSIFINLDFSLVLYIIWAKNGTFFLRDLTFYGA